ncbi:phage tail tape measure protein [Paraburkholderia sp. USG1]|uniref:phage tail tape measure protein n=1 Tax=Paraburkholderia sp. USG1 TaxID=2952268 RepID=UPI00285BA8C2|nr:phage tail tape measure protein [Paraburkholderia sp. USG1]MDR8400115.1 phage tail tape measure protein [Paraburkholderia sp. USG1]
MANETVVRLTGDASGYISEMDRARKSAADFVTSQDAIRQRLTNSVSAIDASRKALQDQGQAAVDAFNKSAKTAESWLTSLQKQADQAGKTRSQLMELRAAELGVSDAAQPYIDKIKAAEQAMNSGAHGAEGFNLATAGARRELLVLAHEMSQGNWKNFGGSLLVLGERTDAMSMLFNKTALTIGAFVGVIAVAATTIYHARDVLAEYGEQVENLHKKTGESTDSIQQWAFAAKSVGVDMKDATKTLTDLGDAQNKAVSGNKDAAKAFSAVGISLADLKKSSPEQLLPQIADAFSKSADSASKAAVANELFGSSGNDLIPLLDRGRAGLDDLRAAAQGAGAVIGGETVAQMAALKEQMDLSKAKMDALTLSAKAQLLPTIINLTDAMTGNVAMKPLLNDFYNGVAVIMKSAATAVATLVVGFEQTSEVVATLASVTALALSGEFRLAVNAAQVGYDNLKKQGEGYSQFLNKLWSNTAPPAASGGSASGPTLSFSKGDGGQKHQKAYTDDGATRFMQQLRDQAAEMESQLSTTGKMTEAEKELTKFNQQISDWKGKTLTADQKSLVANQDAIRAQLQKNVELSKEVQHTEDINKLKERSAQIDASIASYQEKQRDQYGRELDAFGMGSDALKNVQAVKGIYAEYQRQQDQLNKATPKGLIGGDDYKKAQADIQAGLDQSLQDYDAYYAALKAKQADWTNGATAAIANYNDAAHNMAAQTESAVTNAAKGMEDALVSFAMTGKLSFKSLADSIISDIIRMQARAAVSGLFSAAISAAGSYFGGSFGNGFGTAAANVQGGNTLDNLVSNTGGWGTIPARATGGPVDAGTTYLVGEKGPELFNPGTSGTIIPNHAITSSSGGGDLTVSVPVTVQGSNSAADQQNAGDLSTKIRQAVQAVLQSERKQGGVLWKMQNRVS